MGLSWMFALITYEPKYNLKLTISSGCKCIDWFGESGEIRARGLRIKRPQIVFEQFLIH